MEWHRLGQGFGVLGIVGGSIGVWYAFQRQMCTMVAGGPDHCAPNIVYLVPGVLAVLIGFGLLVFLYRRQRSKEQQTTGAK